jgi:hypothetical protein
MNQSLQAPIITNSPSLYKAFNGYEIFNIYGCGKEAIHEKIVDLWTRNRALPPDVNPDERLKQVVLVALDENKKAVAVNTVYNSSLSEMDLPDSDGAIFHAYRMFVERGKTVMWLPIAMTCGAFDILEELNHDGRYRGVLIRTDNPKVGQRSSLDQFARQGWPVYAHDRQGRVIMRRDFGVKKAGVS